MGEDLAERNTYPLSLLRAEHTNLADCRGNIRSYEGRSTSLELCRRGYVVISIDCFYFGERRTLFPDQKAFSGRSRDSLSVEEIRQILSKTQADCSDSAKSPEGASCLVQLQTISVTGRSGLRL